VEFYGGKKGLVVINESTSKDFELIVKKFLMKAAHFIFKKEGGRWPDLKPWWYLFSHAYQKGGVDHEVPNFIFETDVLFSKYVVWLLKNIFGDDFDRIK
jgi:hypothetical protein